MSGLALVEDGGTAPAVLVVDDEDMLRVKLARALRKTRLNVVEAGHADAAIEALGKSKNISAVITNVQVAGLMDGIGLAGWMREHAPGVPVIMISRLPPNPRLRAISPTIPIVVVREPHHLDEVVGWVRLLVNVDGDLSASG